jgi:hypothetical protein
MFIGTLSLSLFLVAHPEMVAFTQDKPRILLLRAPRPVDVPDQCLSKIVMLRQWTDHRPTFYASGLKV